MSAGLDPSYAGVWAQRGYGSIIQISATRLVTYDLTDVSCLQLDDQPLDAAAREFDRVERIPNGFRLFEIGGVTRYEFRALQKLPERCRGAANAKSVNDPETNFWVLWHAFRENYAFFDLRGVDWDEVYARFRPSITPATTPDELFETLSDMLELLDDGHVALSSGDDDDDDAFSSGDDGELLELWESLHGSEDGYVEAVRRHIVDYVLKGKVKSGAGGTLLWGWAAPGVGYINTLSMELPGDKPALPGQVKIVEQAMAQAMTDLGSARTVIVDARFNDGGYDAIALAIMGPFTSERRLAFTKQAVEGESVTPVQEVYFGPSGSTQYAGEIYYLQSGTTISAGEVLSMAMYAHPKVTSIGTPTYGVFSDLLEKKLPNEWSMTLSNELYRAFDGRLFEASGVPPDVALDVSGINDFDERLRLDIDTALLRIGKQ